MNSGPLSERMNVLPTALGQKDTDHLIELLQSLVEHRA